jgi:hypothetical protein
LTLTTVSVPISSYMLFTHTSRLNYKENTLAVTQPNLGQIKNQRRGKSLVTHQPPKKTTQPRGGRHWGRSDRCARSIPRQHPIATFPGRISPAVEPTVAPRILRAHELPLLAVAAPLWLPDQGLCPVPFYSNPRHTCPQHRCHSGRVSRSAHTGRSFLG